MADDHAFSLSNLFIAAALEMVVFGTCGLDIIGADGFLPSGEFALGAL